MSARERTLQQRDPLAALVGRPTGHFAAVGIPVFAAAMTWANRESIVSPVLAAVSLALLVAAGIVLVVLSSPLRAPFTARSLVAVLSLSLLALCASALSMGHNDVALRDDWGAPSVGLFLLALAPYRPARDLVVAGVLSALLVGVVALVQAEYFVEALPPVAFVVVAATPVLAMSLAAASFSQVLVRGLDRWSARARMAFTAMSDEQGRTIARSVQQDSVTVLNRDVVPFLTALRDSGTVTGDTRERARMLADVVRAAMVADVDRSWLDGVLEGVVPQPATGGRMALSDPDSLADGMSADERTALRALIVALHGNASFEPAESGIRIAALGERSALELTAVAPGGEHALRSLLAPYLAVVRVMFADLQVEHESEALTLRFSYEQRG